MTEATALATFRALDALDLRRDLAALVFDGVVDPFSGRLELSRFGLPRVVTEAKADRTSALVAAASIVAKVARDAYMVELDPSFPAYGFAKNKGYPAEEHRRALLGYGLTTLHRRTWRYTSDWVIGPSAGR
jgi:ribonuclease HII